MDNQVYFATCSPRKIRGMKKRHYNVSPDGVSSLDEYTTTITYETNTPTGGGRTRRMSITISDGNSSNEMNNEPAVIAESLETSSLLTQSTNCSRTTGSPLPSPSSGLSLATTATCKKSSLKSHFALITRLMKHKTRFTHPKQATQWTRSNHRRIGRKAYVRRLARSRMTSLRHKRISMSTFTVDDMPSTSPIIPDTG